MTEFYKVSVKFFLKKRTNYFLSFFHNEYILIERNKKQGVIRGTFKDGNIIHFLKANLFIENIGGQVNGFI